MKPILHQAIRIHLKPSHLMLVLQGLISIISCWILVVLPIALTIKWAAVLLVIASSVYFTLRDILHILPWSWQVAELDSKGQLSLTNRRGQQFQPALANSTLMHPILTILNFKRKGISLALPPVILLETLANKDAVRQLRIWLRWAKQHQAQYQEDVGFND